MFFSYLEQFHSMAVLGSIYSKTNAQCNFWAFPNPIIRLPAFFFCLCAIFDFNLNRNFFLLNVFVVLSKLLFHVKRINSFVLQRRCKLFVYGGCKGNGNNFVSEVQCLQKCGDESDLALLPQVEITTEIGKYIEL